MRRPLAGLAALAVAAAAGCGEVSPADFFVVTRTGPGGARLELVVDEQGKVRCNGGAAGTIGDSEIVQARGIQEDIREAATRGTRLAPRPGSVFSYSVRDQDGTVGFADNSAGAPKALQELQLFVLRVATEHCAAAGAAAPG